MGALIRTGQPLKIWLSHHPLLQELYEERKTLYREEDVSNHVFQQDLLSLLLCSVQISCNCNKQSPTKAASKTKLLRPNLKRNCQKKHNREKHLQCFWKHFWAVTSTQRVLSFRVIWSIWICHSFTALKLRVMPLFWTLLVFRTWNPELKVKKN